KLKRNYILRVLALMVLVAGMSAFYRYVQVPLGLTTYLYTYAVVTGLHLLASVRLWNTGKTGRLAVVGALLLMVSTGLLVYNKFNLEGDKYWQIAAMLTYGVAQYLIIDGLISYT